MENNEFKNLIESARLARGLSQRELSKQIGLSQSTYNDTINGKIKKVDVEILKKIANGLDLSLEEILRLTSYNDVLSCLDSNQYKNKSTKDFVDIIEKYKQSEIDLLNFDSEKRKIVRKVRSKLLDAKDNLSKLKKEENIKIFDETEEIIEWATEELKMVQEKYDYSKLPKQ